MASDLSFHSGQDGDLALSRPAQALEAALLWTQLLLVRTQLNLLPGSLRGWVSIGSNGPGAVLGTQELCFPTCGGQGVLAKRGDLGEVCGLREDSPPTTPACLEQLPLCSDCGRSHTLGPLGISADLVSTRVFQEHGPFLISSLLQPSGGGCWDPVHSCRLMGALLRAQRCVRMMGTSQGLGKAGPVQSGTAAAGLSQHENHGVWLSRCWVWCTKHHTSGGYAEMCCLPALEAGSQETWCRQDWTGRTHLWIVDGCFSSVWPYHLPSRSCPNLPFF